MARNIVSKLDERYRYSMISFPKANWSPPEKINIMTISTK
jgi:hypothetical protein